MNANKQLNLQDTFLNAIRKDKVEVTIFLTNGFQIKGIVKGYDSFVVLMESDGKQQMIYKHAISTVAPQRPVMFSTNAGASEEKDD